VTEKKGIWAEVTEKKKFEKNTKGNDVEQPVRPSTPGQKNLKKRAKVQRGFSASKKARAHNGNDQVGQRKTKGQKEQQTEIENPSESTKANDGNASACT